MEEFEENQDRMANMLRVNTATVTVVGVLLLAVLVWMFCYRANASFKGPRDGRSNKLVMRLPSLHVQKRD